MLIFDKKDIHLLIKNVNILLTHDVDRIKEIIHNRVLALRDDFLEHHVASSIRYIKYTFFQINTTWQGVRDTFIKRMEDESIDLDKVIYICKNIHVIIEMASTLQDTPKSYLPPKQRYISYDILFLYLNRLVFDLFYVIVTDDDDLMIHKHDMIQKLVEMMGINDQHISDKANISMIVQYINILPDIYNGYIPYYIYHKICEFFKTLSTDDIPLLARQWNCYDQIHFLPYVGPIGIMHALRNYYRKEVRRDAIILFNIMKFGQLSEYTHENSLIDITPKDYLNTYTLKKVRKNLSNKNMRQRYTYTKNDIDMTIKIYCLQREEWYYHKQPLIIDSRKKQMLFLGKIFKRKVKDYQTLLRINTHPNERKMSSMFYAYIDQMYEEYSDSILFSDSYHPHLKITNSILYPHLCIIYNYLLLFVQLLTGEKSALNIEENKIYFQNICRKDYNRIQDIRKKYPPHIIQDAHMVIYFHLLSEYFYLLERIHNDEYKENDIWKGMMNGDYLIDIENARTLIGIFLQLSWEEKKERKYINYIIELMRGPVHIHGEYISYYSFFTVIEIFESLHIDSLKSIIDVWNEKEKPFIPYMGPDGVISMAHFSNFEELPDLIISFHPFQRQKMLIHYKVGARERISIDTYLKTYSYSKNEHRRGKDILFMVYDNIFTFYKKKTRSWLEKYNHTLTVG